MVQKILIFNFFFIFFLYFYNFSFAKTVSGIPQIIDGDTININNEKIRLHGIDAPEQNQFCFINSKKWPCGEKSTIALKKLINNQKITCNTLEVDRYDRYIAVCFVKEININKMMVKNGWAIAYKYYSLDYIKEEKIAQKNKLGIWKGNFEEPYFFRKKNK